MKEENEKIIDRVEENIQYYSPERAVKFAGVEGFENTFHFLSHLRDTKNPLFNKLITNVSMW